MNEGPQMTIEQRKLEIESKYIVQTKDQELMEKVQNLVKNAKRCLEGGGSKERILLLIGESDTGKTTALHRIFKSEAAFADYRDENGRLISPLLSMLCPNDCSKKALALAFLEKWSIFPNPRVNAGVLWSMIKRQLHHRQIMYLHLDEMQHINTGDTEKAIRDVQDFIKSLTQIDGWPLHLILSGMPAMTRLVESDEIGNRTNIQRFDLVSPTPDNVASLDGVIKRIITKHAGLQVGWADEDQLTGRLIVASKGAFATMIGITRQAIFRVLDQQREAVTIEDFAAAYKSRRACLKSENPFLADNWTMINPSISLADMKPISRKGKR